MTNAEKLKSFRLKHNLTQQQIADLLGVSQQIITYIETGAREPSDGFKLAFLRHYKVDFDKLGLEQEKAWHKTSDEISKVDSEYTVKLKLTLAEIKKLVEKEFCRHPECCEFCANSNDCLNQKIIEKIKEVEDEKESNRI